MTEADDKDAELKRLVQQIARGYFTKPDGKLQRLSRYQLSDMARDACALYGWDWINEKPVSHADIPHIPPEDHDPVPPAIKAACRPKAAPQPVAPTPSKPVRMVVPVAPSRAAKVESSIKPLTPAQLMGRR